MRSPSQELVWGAEENWRVNARKKEAESRGPKTKPRHGKGPLYMQPSLKWHNQPDQQGPLERALYILRNATRLAFAQGMYSDEFWEEFYLDNIAIWLRGEELWLHFLVAHLEHKFRFSEDQVKRFLGHVIQFNMNCGNSFHLQLPTKHLGLLAQYLSLPTPARTKKRAAPPTPTLELQTFRAKKPGPTGSN